MVRIISVVYYLSIIILAASCQKSKDPIAIEILESYTLSEELQECSGFVFTDNHLLAINDSNNPPEIITLETNGAFVKKDLIDGINNTDWECIIADQSHLYIGDIGNNFGSRKDLKIYKVVQSNMEVEDSIPVIYPNQKRFDQTLHNFDSEAIIILDGRLLLFTKDRKTPTSHVYLDVPDQGFALIDSIEVPSLITDAYYHEEKQKVILLGSRLVDSTYLNHITILELNDDYRVKDGYEIISLNIQGQVEAVTMDKSLDEVYIGSEGEGSEVGKLYKLRISNY